jgi:hypothetical protein
LRKNSCNIKSKNKSNSIMKKNYFKVIIASLLFCFSLFGTIKADNNKKTPVLVINGTNNTATFTLETKELHKGQSLEITAPNGFTVSPTTLSANTGKSKITVTLNSTMAYKEGFLVVRSGDIRQYVKVIGHGSTLPSKDISKSPIYKGSDSKLIKTKKDGFIPTEKGYTIEFRVKTDGIEKEFLPYFVDANGYGLKANINSGEGSHDTGIALFSVGNKRGVSNPITSVEGGRGKFYNTDGQFHTYRFSVTPDRRMFIYRDGLAIDTVRLADFGTQPDFATEKGEIKENLLRNPNFEGEYEHVNGDVKAPLKSLEGWHIAILDRWCAEQFIVKHEFDNEQDFNNQILRLRPYKWAASWGDPQIIQIVDVVPNETYTLSALARGGIKKKTGDLTGKLVINEVQDRNKKAEVLIASNSFETYSLDYTTSSECKQIRIVLHTGGAKRGEDVSALEVDNLKLTGMSRKYSPKVGFENNSADVEYFTYDLTGAYAPIQPEINITIDNK